jgi:hypothetical protein
MLLEKNSDIVLIRENMIAFSELFTYMFSMLIDPVTFEPCYISPSSL